jgi:membrane protease YdiL (CAAX protease family)
VYGLSILVGKILGRIFSYGETARTVGIFSVLPSVGSYTTLIVASVALAACWSGHRWRHLGFQWAKAPWWRFVLYAFVAGGMTTLALKMSPGQGMGAALKGLNVFVILLIVVYGSFAEELFTRGWLQGFLRPFRDRRVRILGAAASLPVLVSGAAFGAMHLTLLWRGVDGWTIGFILAFTTVVGLLAAEVRERTESLLPAVITHLSGNAGGVFGGMIYVAIYAARHGQMPEL